MSSISRQAQSRDGVRVPQRNDATSANRRSGSFLLAAALALALPGAATAQNLVGLWTFDGNLNDSSGRNNPARPNAATNFVRGNDGQALALSGTSLTIPNSPSLQTNQLTVAYWVYMDAAKGDMAIVSKGATAGAIAWQTNVVPGLDSNGTWGQSLQFCLGSGSSFSPVCETSQPISPSPAGRWMHVVFTYDGTTAVGYADGVQVLSFAWASFPGNNPGDIHLGAADFHGLVRDLRIYDSPLSLAALAQQGSGAVLGTNTITVGNAAAPLTVVLSASGAWTAAANASFLHITAGSASGTGSALVQFSIDPFTSTGSRTGTLTIAGLTLTVIQGGTNYAFPPEPLLVTGLLDHAMAVAVDSAGNIFTVGLIENGVDTSGNPIITGGSLQKISAVTGAVTTLATGFNNPLGVAVDSSGNVYIADTGNHAIKEWSPATQQVTTLISSFQVQYVQDNGSPNGIAVDASGNLYIAVYDPSGLVNEIVMWNKAAQQLTYIIGMDGVLFYGIAVDVAGNVYFGANGVDIYLVEDSQIFEWNPSTQIAPPITSAYATPYPYGVAVDGSGNVDFISFVPGPNRDVVNRWNAATGATYTTFATSFGPTDRELAVSSSGDLYISSDAHTGVYERPAVLLPNTAASEPITAGTDVLPPVLPVTTRVTGILAPVSDQPWLTVGTVTGGAVSFSFTANTTGVARTAHITIAGVSSTITQNLTTMLNLTGQTQSAATAAITAAGLTPGSISAVLSGTVPAGSVVGTYPVAGTVVTLGSVVNLAVAAGSAALGSSAIQVDNAAASNSVVLAATGAWSATSNSSFLHLGAGSTSGSGSALIDFTIDPFNSPGTRTGTLTIAGLTFTVTQYGTNFLPAQQTTTLLEQSLISGVALDAAGNIYLADIANNAIDQWLPATQQLTTLATGFNSPNGVALDSSGNVFIADTSNNVIERRSVPTGVVGVIAAGLKGPRGVATDAAGNVYFSDTGNNAIEEWNGTTGAVTTLVSGLNAPGGVAVDRSGNVYIANSGSNAIEEWSVTTGIVTPLVTGLNSPEGVAVDGAGNVYIADTNNFAIKKWTAATGQVTTLDPGYSYPSAGVAVDAADNVYAVFNNSANYSEFPALVKYTFTFAPAAQVPNVVSQTQAAASSVITSVGLVVGAVTTTVSATVAVGSVISTSPAAGTTLVLGSSVSLVVSAQPEQVPNVVGQTQAAATAAIGGVNLTAAVTTGYSATVASGIVISQNPAAGTTVVIYSAVNLVVSAGQFPVLVPNVIAQTLAAATSAIAANGLVVGSITTTVNPTGLNNPGGVISDLVGNVYIADTGNNAIKKWNAATSTLTTLVSTGLNQPGGVGIDKAGNIYIADTGNNAIKEWSPVTNQVTTLVSTGLNHPKGIVVDRYFQGSYSLFGPQQVASLGNVYIADTGNNAVKLWTAATQQVTTLVSTGLNAPAGIGFCIGGIGGTLIIADTGNNAIKSYTGVVTTLISTGLSQPSAVVCAAYTDNSTGFFNSPASVPVDFIPIDDLYIADSGNNAVKWWNSRQNTLTTLASGLNQPLGVASDGQDNVWFTDTGNSGLQEVVPQCGPVYGQYCNQVPWLVSTTSTLIRTVPPGTVSNANPAAGTTVSFGSAVNLTIEAGMIGLSASSVLVGSAAGSSSVFLTVEQYSNQAPWSATANNSFLHLAAGSSSGSGSAWIAFTIDAFGGTGIRAGTLTIDGLTFTVTQVGTDYAATSQLTTPIQGGFNAPNGLAVDGFGNLYIADTGNNVVKKWSVATQQVSTLVSGLNGPAAVAVDGDGNLYIGDGSAIHFWNASTQQLTTLVPGLNTGSTGVALDPSGNVYFSTGPPTTISEWVAATQTVTPLVSSGLSAPRGVALDSSGNVYFADAQNNLIEEWSAATRQVTTLVGTGLARPQGVAVDGSTGDVYFCDAQNSAVKMWSAATQQVTTVVQGSPVGPTNVYRGLARDASGNLYFSEATANVIGRLSKAYVSSGSLIEPNPAGADALPAVIPVTTSLTGVFAPVSDQSWLTIGTVANGIVNFSFTTNATGSPRTAHITVLGIQVTVTQGLLVAVPNVAGQTQAAATTAITGAGLVLGTVTTASSSTIAAGSVVSTSPVAATQVNVGSAVNLLVSTGPVQAAVPNVVGQTQAAATTAITGAGLVVGTVTTASSGTVAAGNVISTNPTAATQVNVGSAVSLVVSTGPAQVAVPNVVGQTQAAATTAITGAGLVVGTVTTASSSTVATGNVISTNPTAATQVNVSSAVNLVVSTGPAQVAVPNIVGQTQAAATTAITGAGLVVGTVTTASSSTVAAGSVISTNPAAVTQVNVGSAVSLVVSTGPAQVAVPNVVGQTQAAATTAITGAGLVVGTVTTASSSTVAAGSVISTNPAAVTQVNVGSAVNLVVSTGPAQVAVPNVVGQTQAAATTAITGAGLVVGTVTTASSSTVATGKVISTNPTSATQVNLGSAVSLVVSTGPAQVAVPNVVGQTQAGATSAITGAGLVVGTVTTASSSTVATGKVISTNPTSATQVNLGSAVNLVVSTGPAPAQPTVISYNVICGAACAYNMIGTTRVHLPWLITGIQVVFSQVITSASVNSLTGVAATGFSGLGTNTLTWTFAGVANSSGSLMTALAGTGPNAIQSAGGALTGSNTSQALKILQGDFNDDGVVNASDITLVNNARSAAYNIFADINGDGIVNTADVTAVRAQNGQTNP